MTLTMYQEALQSVLMTPQGRKATDSKATWRAFVEQQLKSQPDWLRASLIRQPLTRLKQYQYMVVANIADNVEHMMPISRQLLAGAWDDLIEAFFCQMPPDTFHLITQGERFIEYLEEYHADLIEADPYLPDLMLYEWIEADVLNAPNSQWPSAVTHLPVTPSLDAPVVINPVASPLQLSYNIAGLIEAINQESDIELDMVNIRDRIPAELLAEQPSFYWVNRSVSSPYECHYLTADPMLLYWLDSLKNDYEERLASSGSTLKPPTLRESLQPIFEVWQAQQPDATFDAFVQPFIDAIPMLREKQILL